MANKNPINKGDKFGRWTIIKEVLNSPLCCLTSDYKAGVIKNLEEAAERYIEEEDCKNTLEELGVKCAFKAGAEWQKQYLMQDAVERVVKVDAGGYPYIDATELYDYDNDKPLANDGDKVKILILRGK